MRRENNGMGSCGPWERTDHEGLFTLDSGNRVEARKIEGAAWVVESTLPFGVSPETTWVASTQGWEETPPPPYSLDWRELD